MIMDIFLKNGVPEKTIYAIQKAQRSRNNDNPDLLAQIKDAESLGYKIDKKDINDFFNQDLEPLLKGPVKEILEKLVKDGHKLFLFTKGVEYFQRSKIRRSGIEEYFDENIYVFDSNKEETDVDIDQHEKTFFINDHADEIEDFAKAHPKVKFIYVKGPKTSHDRFIKHKHIPTIDDISSLSKYIK